MNVFISEVLGYLIDFTQYIQRFFGNIGFSKLNYGWLIALFFVFAVFLIGLSVGRSRILMTMLCLYIAAFIEPRFLYFDKLQEIMKGKPDFWLHVGLFFIIFIISFMILNRSILKQSLVLREISFLPIAFVAVLEIGFLASLIMNFLPPEIVGNLPYGVIRFFGTENAQFWWALVPLAALIFMKGKKRVSSLPS